MGDRTNPIKFGPEWLRNLSREGATTGTQGGAARDVGHGAAPPGLGGSRPGASPGNNAPKVLLARLRYGREEMLALYDRQTAEAPAQLKSNDTLYQPRGKPPYALNNSFEDETRESVIRQPAISGPLAPSDRYAGRGRVMSMTENKSLTPPRGENRGRGRGYTRPISAGRGWHGSRVGGAYSGIPDDDPSQPLRPWSNNNSLGQSGLRPNNGEQPDWQTKQAQYRVKRQTSTNWRQQQGRDDGEEWRAPDGPRRPQDKWEWGWQQEPSGRPTQDKQWHSNRRTWVAGESNEDSLPEWAVDNAEACGGTFDSSGAFHGYSNDDSNLPKNQENPYPLTKSHTHGSFARSKMAEEGSEEWWASEKAKKLSPKRFDASDLKKVRFSDSDFKKPLGPSNADEKSNLNSASTKNSGSNDPGTRNTGAIPKRTFPTNTTNTEKKPRDQPAQTGTSKNDEDSPETKPAGEASKTEEKNKTEEVSKEKTYDSRFETEKQNEKGNIQSVILTSNNTLRQKHQNISVTPTETPKRQPKLMEYLDNNQPRQIESKTREFDSGKGTDSDKIVEDILQMSLDDGIPSATINQLLTSHSNSSLNSLAQVPYPPMQMRMSGSLQGLGLNAQNVQNASLSSGMQTQDSYNGMIQPMGITNSMLNASLGLPMPNSSTGMGQGITQSLSNTGLSNQNTLGSGLQGVGGANMPLSGLQTGGMQSGQVSGMQGHHMQGLQGFGMQPAAAIQSQLNALPNNMQASGPGPGLQSATNSMSGVGNNALFSNQLPSNLPNTVGENVHSLHRLQQLASQSFGNMMYGGNVINQPPPINNMGMQQIMSSDQWYYEDPNNTIQGPFSSQEMYYWYRAGFFSPTLLVRRGCEAVMRPLGSYGPMPFGPMDLLSPFPMGGGYDIRPQQSHEATNQQPGLGVDVQSLWGQPTNNAPAPDRMWMPNNNTRPNNPINNFQLHFWNNQASELPTPPLLPETMKTEEEILAQMRAAQAQGPTSPLSFFAETPAAPQEVEANTSNANLNINQLQKLIQKDTAAVAAASTATGAAADLTETEQVSEKPATVDTSEVPALKASKSVDKTAEVKAAKEVKIDNKQKGKDATPKSKSKKSKDEKKEETVEVKPKDEEVKAEKRSAEPSPSPKNKKEDKSTKKDLDKEKKEWIKEGFTIVKSAEKTKDKDSKKKAEEAKVAEEAERKRKEEEKLAAEEKKRQLEAIKKQQQESQNQVSSASRQAVESVSKKAPWSASSQALPSTRDGPTLAEIQRLEREKKLEQMKEQQQMMQIIAQQQAAALAREQELQTGLGWAKKPSTVAMGPTLAEIQAEARKQAASAAAAAAVAVPREEAQLTPPPTNTVPWATIHNGGAGFWDSPQPEPVKPAVKHPEPKAESKNKKKVTVMAPPKQENTPSVEFDMWCTNMLVSWRDTGIDVPTFVSFLRDIESPYEVKDYVKCYLGDTREANDFARQFLEKRSRLMRVGMVTPSDDLCSPAVAVNPRTNSGSDHADLKTKGKKTKKNKMLKVDARNILGFSVTASEDRINVGDIDTV